MSKKILIIGGGLGGIGAATSLLKTSIRGLDIEITLVEPKAYIEVPWAAVRALFDEAIAEQTTIPMSRLLAKYPKLNHIRSKVSTLNKTSAILENGNRVSFEVCIIATGSVLPYAAIEPWEAPHMDADEENAIRARRKHFRKNGEKLLNAKSVLIIGGGLIGTELAGDLAGYAALRGENKPKVTLVHSGKHLVPEFTEGGAKKLQELLEKFGVEVILNERATNKNGKWYLKTGTEVRADIVAKCYGVSPVNNFIKGGNLKGCLDKNGWIMVDDFLRVRNGDGRIFAVGDCCDALRKAAASAVINKDVIAKNTATTLLGIENGTNLKDLSLKKKVIPPAAFGITVGPKDGVFQLPHFSTTWFLPWLKNRNMFLSSAIGKLGL